MSVNNVIDIEIPSIKKEVKPKIKEVSFLICQMKSITL